MTEIWTGHVRRR